MPAMTAEGWFALVVAAVPVLLVYGFAVVDLVRRRPGPVRFLGWMLVIVLLPGFGVLAYFVMRPLMPSDGEEEGEGVADAVARLRDLRAAGDLDDAGYLRAKQQLFRV